MQLTARDTAKEPFPCSKPRELASSRAGELSSSSALQLTLLTTAHRHGLDLGHQLTLTLTLTLTLWRTSMASTSVTVSAALTHRFCRQYWKSISAMVFTCHGK